MEWLDIVGKTIKKVDNRVDALFIEFTDGTSVRIQASRAMWGTYVMNIYDKSDLSYDTCEVS